MDFLPPAHGKFSFALLEETETEGALAWTWFQMNYGFIIPIPILQTASNLNPPCGFATAP